MRVDVSDNAFRSLAAAASDVVTEQGVALTRAITGTSVGAALGRLSGTSTAVAVHHGRVP